MRRKQAPLLLALVLSLGGSVAVADAQSAPCPTEAWRRVEHFVDQNAALRGGSALWSRADRVTMFKALGGHERVRTAIGNRSRQDARVDPVGVRVGDEAISTIVRTDLALVARIEYIPNTVEGAARSAVARLRAVDAERCLGLGSRIINARLWVQNSEPTR